MDISYRIAVRYFFSRNKRSFISLIARIAMAGVAVGTMAMVVVLSVFNGMEDLNRQIFKTFDSDVRIVPAEGKRFKMTPALMDELKAVKGVKLVTKVVEDNALARYGSQQTIIRLKGVDSTFEQQKQLDTAIIEGSVKLVGDNGTPYAIIAEGIRNALSISLEDIFTPLELLYPRTGTKTLNLTSPEAFNQLNLRPGGVFSIESRYDDYIIAPLKQVESLMGYNGELSALEVYTAPGYTEKEVSEEIGAKLGKAFVVKDRDSLNADLLRAIKMEKLFVAVTLSLIILVAAINIFFSLSMLAIEKKKDVSMLFAMGATQSLVRRIFLAEGAIVAFSGAIAGLLGGIAICWLQMRYGFVSMGMTTSLVDAYPVKLIWEDILYTGVIVVMITMVVSYIPARRAAEAGALLRV
ncbi:lipoprotein-releasing system permease protein [Dyadobacter sp. BE34]|uniref:Lipoprotein-releasing system permease protein n=1 Tax=Dyadobacter fermentans TaxID=94254 RepID=A0ABU1QRU3_9BACT|nr:MULTISPECIES: FtsX-like permease family protein [Dyadobacter]MDR6803880.1 lipoprotein-releasing system permease protein [Dyadobacter fermentans]MDR7041620.1 lipoprotein-releasing system permease protein [Dyadobacter sp. BE242]MDR7196023.1 lipoprotein-releasing system permease protein [Dyadobacter sp. BE34]MDR7213432.1 lipoprotein-releasing system permease protein [Dyadobacter sp. BE31]MDR7261429.1 lipoprotein-releasing system permease protein [Dyadobacter sp. BE32]